MNEWMNAYKRFFDNDYFDCLADYKGLHDAEKCMLTTGDKILAIAKRYDALYASKIDI